MRASVQKFLVAYSALVSTALLGLVLLGAASPRKSDFDEIRAHRIDIVEPDGTLRMVIANKDRLLP